MTGRHEVVVTRELTVGAHVDGMPFVFGTPMMILAMEMASAAAAAPHLPAGWVTVGSEVHVRHLAPTPIGRTVVAIARVVEVSGRAMLLASKRMTASGRSARGRTGAARSIWRVSSSASGPSSGAAGLSSHRRPARRP
jgi:predicted thioesterase